MLVAVEQLRLGYTLFAVAILWAGTYGAADEGTHRVCSPLPPSKPESQLAQKKDLETLG
jgi:hypothetical protein